MVVDEYYDEEVIVDEEVIDDDDMGDEDLLTSIQASFQNIIKTRKAEKETKNGEEEEVIEEEETQSDEGSEYEEQVIEKWFEREVEPDDMEAACRYLIPIVYKGQDIDLETMMRRTPLPELYKYLKQHFDYRKEIKKDVSEEEAKPVKQQTTLQTLFANRSQQNPSLEVNVEEMVIPSFMGRESMESTATMGSVYDEEIIEISPQAAHSVEVEDMVIPSFMGRESMESTATMGSVYDEEIIESVPRADHSVEVEDIVIPSFMVRGSMESTATMGSVYDEEIIEISHQADHSVEVEDMVIPSFMVRGSMESTATMGSVYDEEIIESVPRAARESFESVFTVGSEYEEQLVENGVPPAIGRKSIESTVTVEAHEDEDLFASIKASLQDEFRARKAEKESEKLAKEIVQEETHSDEESLYEEQVIEKWFGRDVQPEDLEAACRDLIPIVYKWQDFDPDTMIRRTPLPELYKYLKQHFDYKEMKNELQKEETELLDRKNNLQALFQKRSQEAGGSDKQGSSDNAQSPRNVKAPLQRLDSEFIFEEMVDETEREEDSHHLECEFVGDRRGLERMESELTIEEVIEDTKFKLSMDLSERTLEELVDETEVEEEETLREEDDGDEIVEEIEETYHESSVEEFGDVYEEVVDESERRLSM